jgi:catechol 2,3-dioxygenase-like lactoylglutathione lyase family enzyme
LLPNNAPTLFIPSYDPIVAHGIGYVALAVDSLESARSFYCSLLGFVEDKGLRIPDCGEHIVLRTATGQLVALCHATLLPLPDLGRHIAFGFSREERDDIVLRMQRQGIEILRYHEDRPSEADDNFYVIDPFGMRIQLVVSPSSIDHVCLQAIDLEWEEDLYIRNLGFSLDHLVGWRTEDYRRARRWADGLEDMAPGTRRKDLRFGTLPGQAPLVPRPNLQMFVKVGAQSLGVFLAFERYQIPQPDVVIGIPRIGIVVPEESLHRVGDRFEQLGLGASPLTTHADRTPFAASVYAYDYSANYLDFCTMNG